MWSGGKRCHENKHVEDVEGFPRNEWKTNVMWALLVKDYDISQHTDTEGRQICLVGKIML